MTFLAATILLFFIMDPFGNMVAVNCILADYSPRRRRWIVLRESLIAFAILALFLFGGAQILSVLGIQTSTLSISGGIILFLIALGMVFPTKTVMPSKMEDEPLIVPVAVPMIAGPSCIAALVLMASREPDRMLTFLGSLTLAVTASTLILWASPTMFRILGKRGSIAIERLMGMLLVMLSIQMLLDGIHLYLDQF